jgi:hypothetical protein
MAHATKHLGVRMSQRGITSDMIDLVLAYGENRQDKVVLCRKAAMKLVARLDGAQRATALKVLDKGGLVVVEKEGSLLTAYNLNSFDRRKRGGTRPSPRRPRAYR